MLGAFGVAFGMSYCLLCQDPDPQYFHVMSLSGIPLPGLQEGIVLEPPAQPVEALIAADGRYPGDLLDGPWLLVSSATRKVLSTITVDNVQYFPAVLTTQYTNERYDDYWLLSLLEASSRSIWFAGNTTQGVVLGRMELDGRATFVSLQTPESMLLAGSALDLVVGPDQEAWLLVAEVTAQQTTRFLLFRATDDAGPVVVSPAQVLSTGVPAAIAPYRRCGLLVSHNERTGVSLVEPDAGIRELTLPPAFSETVGGRARQQGRLVALPDGMALLELSPPAIVIFRGVSTSAP